jgi:hypothetical protein
VTSRLGTGKAQTFFYSAQVGCLALVEPPSPDELRLSSATMRVADGVKRTQPPLTAGPPGPPGTLINSLPYQTISCRHPYGQSIVQSEPKFFNFEGAQ